MSRPSKPDEHPERMQASDHDEPKEHADGGTRRRESPELEHGTPLPEEITGRAAGTEEDLVALFADESNEHLADGFRGGSGGEASTDDGAATTPETETGDPEPTTDER